MAKKQETNEADTTRREFIKSSGAVTSAAVLGSLGLHARVHAAGGDTIRLGMIGCGGRNTGAAAQALAADKGMFPRRSSVKTSYHRIVSAEIRPTHDVQTQIVKELRSRSSILALRQRVLREVVDGPSALA